jgi:hypothetical protein
MIEKAINKLQILCNTIPNLLIEIDEKVFCEKPNPNKWSKKEIVGHLIDSATNNHHRFVRGQFEEKPMISYDQNKWNEYSFYQKISTPQIISFWTIYNKQLLELIQHISEENLQRECKVGDKFLTLEFLINDYVEHLEHHLQQVLSY